MAQIRLRNVRAILVKRAVNSVLPSSAPLVAHEAHHLQCGGSLSKRIGTVGRRHSQLSRRSTHYICVVGLSMSASSPVVPAVSTSSAAYSQRGHRCRNGRMCPMNRAASFQSRQLDPTPFLRLADERQLEAEIMPNAEIALGAGQCISHSRCIASPGV